MQKRWPCELFGRRPHDFKQEHANTPWSSIAGLRNVVVHEYFRVDPDMIRDIVDTQLAPLLLDIG